MTRRCSHCGHNGHNSRTCPDRGFKLFGVRLPDLPSSPPLSMAMRKSVSLGNLTSCASFSDAANAFEHAELGASLDEYVSDDVVDGTSDVRERKKGVPWTEVEHRSFLVGLQKLGKGDWRGISRDYVKTRTPTQVASHAQKYFLRHTHLNKRRRRSSLFDIVPDMVSSKEKSDLEVSNSEESDVCPLIYQLTLGQANNPLPLASLSTRSTTIIEEAGDMEDASEALQVKVAATGPSCKDFTSQPPEGEKCSSDSSFPFPLIPFSPLDQSPEHLGKSKILKPTPTFPTSPVRIDPCVKISELSLTVTRPVMEPSPLSYKLSEKRSRHSAFHQMPSISSTKMDKKGNLVNAISVA